MNNVLYGNLRYTKMRLRRHIFHAARYRRCEARTWGLQFQAMGEVLGNDTMSRMPDKKSGIAWVYYPERSCASTPLASPQEYPAEGGSSMTAHKEPQPVETANVCQSHLELLTTLTKIAVNLGWMVRIGFALIPFLFAFLVSHVKLWQQVGHNTTQLTTVVEQFAQHQQRTGNFQP